MSREEIARQRTVAILLVVLKIAHDLTFGWAGVAEIAGGYILGSILLATFSRLWRRRRQ